MTPRTTVDGRPRARWLDRLPGGPFAWLIAWTVLVQVWLSAGIDSGWNDIAIRIAFIASLVVAVEASSRSRRFHQAAIVVASLGVAVKILAGALSIHATHWALQLLDFALILSAPVAVLRHALRLPDVDTQTVLSAVYAYQLLGMAFAFVFLFLEQLEPHAFRTSNGQAIDAIPDLLYFSFVTLTTLGYGDIAPVGAVARSIAVFEAIVGQVYIAVVLARLVGLTIGSAAKERGPGG